MVEIERVLKKIVSNLWFEWNSDVHLLFREIDPYGWNLFRRNLYRFLKVQGENPMAFRRRLAELLIRSEFHKRLEHVEAEFKSYMQPAETLVSKKYPELSKKTIAYFSMEYGVDILGIYSGGLGVLSGDHLRGSSDIGLKMVGVGLLYLNGYYKQEVGLNGEMKVTYEAMVPPGKQVRDFLPLDAVKRAGTQDDLIINVPMPGRDVKVKVWRARMGRNDLLLLDSNLKENHVHDRHITLRLYASQNRYEEERRRRLEQEIILGIGGVKALVEAGYEPAAYHLNEGHVAFAAIEIIKNLMQKYSWNFAEAQEKAAQFIGFTTHTPVPEGNERFDERLVREHLQPYMDQFLDPAGRETVFNCARNREDAFDMTKMSLMLSGVCRNGVSELHGEVCRKMWGFAWGLESEAKVPITSITNAVHAPYWQKPVLRKLLSEMGGPANVSKIPDEKIWDLHMEFKTKLVGKVRERVAHQLLKTSKDEPQIVYEKTCGILDTDAFIIGFARRFADYKRVTMFLEDEERLFQFLEKAYRKYGKPVEILFAGKPHPNNMSGRDRVRQIVEISKRLQIRAAEKNFKASLIFVEGYDIDLARYLEAGVDVWLNNPIRPLEASGTSGMKAGMNGVLNISISDGWVPEGIAQGNNGWLFGKGDADSLENDRGELFRLLEDEVLPAFFDRAKPADAFSRRWVAMMKNSIQTITEKFNTDRMLCEYIEKMYLPAVRNSAAFNMASSHQRG